MQRFLDIFDMWAKNKKKKLNPEHDVCLGSAWRRWRDLNSRAGERPTYRISSADPSTTWVHLQTSNKILLSTVHLIF